MISIRNGAGLLVESPITRSPSGTTRASTNALLLAVGSLTFGSAHGVRPHGFATLSQVWNENALIMQAVPMGIHTST